MVMWCRVTWYPAATQFNWIYCTGSRTTTKLHTVQYNMKKKIFSLILAYVLLLNPPKNWTHKFFKSLLSCRITKYMYIHIYLYNCRRWEKLLETLNTLFYFDSLQVKLKEERSFKCTFILLKKSPICWLDWY